MRATARGAARSLKLEPRAITTGNRRGLSEHDRAQAGDSGGQIRFPAPGPHTQVTGARHTSAARHVRAQPGLKPVGLPSFLPDGEPGERGATFLCRVPGWATL